MKIETLKRPAQFKRLRGGARWAGPLFIMEGRRRQAAAMWQPEISAQRDGGEAPGPRFGFTITRKVGGAVVRNRIRRRLREALRTLGSTYPRADYDYVVVASRAVHDYPFAGLQSALREAFERLHQQSDSAGRRVGSGRDGRKGRRESAPLLSESKSEASRSFPTGDGLAPASQADETNSGNGPGRH